MLGLQWLALDEAEDPQGTVEVAEATEAAIKALKAETRNLVRAPRLSEFNFFNFPIRIFQMRTLLALAYAITTSSRRWKVRIVKTIREDGLSTVLNLKSLVSAFATTSGLWALKIHTLLPQVRRKMWTAKTLKPSKNRHRG